MMMQIKALALASLLLITALAAGPLVRAEDQPVHQPWSQAELDQLLAPVALYPDELLGDVMVAVTRPLDVIAAARWTRGNPDLEGDAAVAAAAAQGFAPSVAALVAFPEILQLMDEDLQWLQRLGEALVLDEAQVMATVQALRQRAWAAGSLERLDHMAVRRERGLIQIQPARSGVVHVPYYNSLVVYGPWWHPLHPPWSWTLDHWGPGFIAAPASWSGPGFWWSGAVKVSRDTPWIVPPPGKRRDAYGAGRGTKGWQRRSEQAPPASRRQQAAIRPEGQRQRVDGWQRHHVRAEPDRQPSRTVPGARSSWSTSPAPVTRPAAAGEAAAVQEPRDAPAFASPRGERDIDWPSRDTAPARGEPEGTAAPRGRGRSEGEGLTGAGRGSGRR